MRNPGTLSLLDAEGTGQHLSSPKSLPDFQRVFPREEACRSVLKIAARVDAPTYAGLYEGTWGHPGGWGG